MAIESPNLVNEEEKVYRQRKNGVPANGQPFRLIDLFSGAGGLTLGFSPFFGHNFQPVWANDYDRASVETYNANFGDHCTHYDIVEFLERKDIQIPEADIVIGGPPCQGFSLLNKERENDPRKQLWRPFLEIVERSGAGIFIMENVPQLLGSAEYEQIKAKAEDKGFNVHAEILCAADYGVPQVRYRAFVIGCKFSNPSKIFPPRKTHYNPEKGGPQLSLFEWNQNNYLPAAKPWKTVRDAIADLPDTEGREIRDVPPPLDLHFGRNPTQKSIERYRAIPEEGMNRFDLQRRAPHLTPQCWIKKEKGGTDLFGRLWWDRPAFTIRTEFFKPEKGRYLHPEKHRPITHREAARLQSFPDNFIFKGSKIEIAKQIGNAVPPALAARIADSAYLLLSEKVAEYG